MGLLNLAMLDVGGMLNQRPQLICVLEKAASSVQRQKYPPREMEMSRERVEACEPVVG